MTVSPTGLLDALGEVLLDKERALRLPVHMPGLKLDFKDPTAVDVSLQFVKQHNWPNPKRLWLNADILQGPGES